MLRKIVGFLFICLTCYSLVGAVASFAQARQARQQAQKMHALALRHRISMPTAMWKHNERAYVAAARRDEAIAVRDAIIAGVCAGCSLVALFAFEQRRFRRSWSYQRSSRSISTSNSISSNSYPTGYIPKPISDGSDVPALHKTLRQTRDEIGKAGEDQLVAALQPLLDDGWRVVERNIDVVTRAGGKFGDIDVLLISPNGVGFCIDAKNGTQRVWYAERTDEVVFDRGWTPKYGTAPKPRRYPVTNAEYLAAWAERHFHIRKVFPIMAFTDNHDLRLEKRVRNFTMLRIENVVDKLRAIDGRFGVSSASMSQYEVPQKDTEG